MTNNNSYDKLASLFKVVAHPIRLCILTQLKDKELCVRELVSLLHYQQAAVSQHLSLLRKNNLVKTRRVGKKVYYSLLQENAQLLKVISSLERYNS